MKIDNHTLSFYHTLVQATSRKGDLCYALHSTLLVLVKLETRIFQKAYLWVPFLQYRHLIINQIYTSQQLKFLYFTLTIC